MGPTGADPRGDRYKWIALSNCTLGILLATLDASITLIAMPNIFRGIRLDPLVPANSFYLLWMILGYLVVSSVLIVSLGRLGDMYGRVRIFNLGFVIYTAASLLLTVDWLTGRAGATFLIIFRIVQGIGAACLLANSAAIITDAFPPDQRGMALGINNIVGVSGMFVGLVLGGLLAPISWRMVFLISVPVGLFGTVWAYMKLEERSKPRRAPVDWAGNLTFALGLILIMVSVTYGIRPYGPSATGWGSPRVIALLGAGVASLVAFVLIERRVENPMFRLPLFRIRAFTFGTLSTFLAAIARGGLMFMLIIWLQGIWLPQHGYDFTQTPLWAGIYMLPLTVGMLLSGPTSGYLSDRFGARGFATGGMIGSALSFFLLTRIPIDFPYPVFAATLFLNGVGMGLFASPNRAGVMNSLPAEHRGAGGGMNQTFQNSAQVLSIGVFFTLMILGLASTLPHAMASGLEAHGVPPVAAIHAGSLPPVSILFAAFLGYNPIQHLLGSHLLAGLAAHSQSVLTGRSFFPHLISGPFRTGLHEAFAFAILACLIAALASFSRGRHPRHEPRPTVGMGAASRVAWSSSQQRPPDRARTPGRDRMPDPQSTFEELAISPAEREALSRLRSATRQVGGPMERHCLRCRHIAADIASRRSWIVDGEVLTVAAILHDIGLYPGVATGDAYVADGAGLARSLLERHGWSQSRIELCAEAVDRHHELRRQRQRGVEIEALRLADLVELSGGLLRFGLDREWLRALRRSVPARGLGGELAREIGRALRERPRTLPRIFLRD